MSQTIEATVIEGSSLPPKFGCIHSDTANNIGVSNYFLVRVTSLEQPRLSIFVRLLVDDKRVAPGKLGLFETYAQEFQQNGNVLIVEHITDEPRVAATISLRCSSVIRRLVDRESLSTFLNYTVVKSDSTVCVPCLDVPYYQLATVESVDQVEYDEANIGDQDDCMLTYIAKPETQYVFVTESSSSREELQSQLLKAKSVFSESNSKFRKSQYTAMMQVVEAACTFTSAEYPRVVNVVGPPGSGKSAFMDDVRNAIEKEIGCIACYTLQATRVLLKHSNLVDRGASQLGNISDALCTLTTDELKAAILFIDGIEVACELPSSEGSPIQGVANQLLSWICDLMQSDSNLSVPIVVVLSCREDQHDRLPKELLSGLQVRIGFPDATERELIAHVLFSRVSVEVDSKLLHHLAQQTAGYSVGDMKSVVRNCVLRTNDRSNNNDGVEVISQTDIDAAIEEVVPRGIANSSFFQLSSERQQGISEGDKFEWKQWNGVAGYYKVKQTIEQLVGWQWENPDSMKRMGIVATTGILLHGPTGCGKTLLAQAIGFRYPGNFISVKASDIFSKYFGDSEMQLRKLFAKARTAAPCILFFDEVDLIVAKRDLSGGGGVSNEVDSRILTTFLSELDGIDTGSKATTDVLVIGATNRIEALDAAVLRPGRLGSQVEVKLPNQEDRFHILNKLTESMPIRQRSQLLDELSQDSITESFSGADLEGLCTEAGLSAVREVVCDTANSESLESCTIEKRHFMQALETRTL